MRALLPFLRLFKFAKLPLFLGLVLMITHRIEDLKQCDNILVMQEGEIVQQGHFNQLKDQGFFAELLAQRKEDIQ